MTEQWNELKETIAELRDNDGMATQHEVCKFLANYMGVLEKQMIDPIDQVLEIIDRDIDFYRQLGKPENQHRDVINAFTDFREEVLALKGERG